MKNFAFFSLLLLFSVFAFSQEQAPLQEVKPGSKTLDILEKESTYGFFESYDNEKKILKVKGEDGAVYDFICHPSEIKLLGKQKNLKFSDLKKGDFIRVFYLKKEEGENIVRRIIKDPQKPKTETPSPSGN